MKPRDFWAPWETVASSFDDVVDFINVIQSTWIDKGPRQFAWRGVVNAGWALDSSLYRRLAWTAMAAGKKQFPDEKALFEAEERIMVDVHRWGLHWNGGQRLPFLLQLALLQHYGAPTRLIDISFNAWIGVWFAVEKKWSNGQEVQGDQDGRLFAIAVDDLIINEQDDYRAWEDHLKRPWPRPAKLISENSGEQLDWMTRVFAWRPPHIDGRIAAQNGGFLLGGVPYYKTSTGKRYWPKSTGSNRKNWPINDVRRSTSVAARPHLLETRGGARPGNPLFALRISADAKPNIRKRLDELFGYTHRTIYPDYPGFSSFGVPGLRQWPPSL